MMVITTTKVITTEVMIVDDKGDDVSSNYDVGYNSDHSNVLIKIF